MISNNPFNWILHHPLWSRNVNARVVALALLASDHPFPYEWEIEADANLANHDDWVEAIEHLIRCGLVERVFAGRVTFAQRQEAIIHASKIGKRWYEKNRKIEQRRRREARLSEFAGVEP